MVFVSLEDPAIAVWERPLGLRGKNKGGRFSGATDDVQKNTHAAALACYHGNAGLAAMQELSLSITHVRNTLAGPIALFFCLHPHDRLAHS